MTDKNFVSILHDGATVTHIPYHHADYDTLCGLDISADSPSDFDYAGKQVFPGRRIVDCPECIAIWQLCQAYTKADIKSK